MTWLEETHGTNFELVRHFLARMFDSEMFSNPGQWRSVAAGAFGLALPAGMVLLDPWYMLAAPKASAIPDELALATLLMAVTGLIALLEWQSLFPSRRDYDALASLPVRPRQVFAARFTVVLLFSAAVVAAINLLPALMASNMAAQGVSSALACFFVLFAIVALQGVLLNTVPASLFARVSGYVQGVLTAVLFLGALLTWSIKSWPQETIESVLQFGAWVPPVWFLGLHERMRDSADPFFAAMAFRALIAAASALVLAVLMYLVSYKRYRALLLEARGDAAPPQVRAWSPLHLLARAPCQQAIMDFIANTLSRSRVHRLVLLAHTGAAAGIMVNSSLVAGALTASSNWRQELEFALLYWPIGTCMIVLRGLRHAFSMPVELRANWIFQITETQGRGKWMSAVERFVIGGVIVPVHFVVAVAAVPVLGWAIATRMTALQLLVSLSVFEILFYSWQQLPFTCSYVPGRRPLTSVLVDYIVVLGFVVPVLARIIGAVGQMLEVFLVYGLGFVVFWLWMRKRRRDGWGEGKIIYEDLPEALPDLGLRG